MVGYSESIMALWHFLTSTDTIDVRHLLCQNINSSDGVFPVSVPWSTDI